MEEAKEKYALLRAEMKGKYHDAIVAIANANRVPLDDAFNMLEANIMRGGNYPYVRVAEFKADYETLKGYSDEIAGH
jgi:hypothetical protein